MNPRATLWIYRVALLVQCFTIFAVVQVNFRYRAVVKEAMSAHRKAQATIDELQTIIMRLTVRHDPILIVTNGQPKP